MNQAGQFKQQDYFDNVGGLNLADSPMRVKDEQATGGYCYQYSKTGGFQKVKTYLNVNTLANSELLSRGGAIFVDSVNIKNVIRAAGRKIQYYVSNTFTNLSLDTTAAPTDIFPDTTHPTLFAQFNNGDRNLLNFVGNTDGVYSIYSTSKVTKNGTAAPTGNITATETVGGGSFTTTGNYYYAVQFRKTSTQAFSNVTLDVLGTLTLVTNSITIDLTPITNSGTGTFDRIYIYRSAVNGVSGFTAGDLIADLPIASTTYVDVGTSILDAVEIARPDSQFDNSVLPVGVYNVIATWKRRLVTAKGSTVYFTDINKPESWPTVNTLTVPSGGPITALSIISFNTDFGNDEYLAVFKERELWLIKGDDPADVTQISLSFIDAVGCPVQSLITTANGYLWWVDYRGIHLWDGANKPIYCSRPVETIFESDGDLDKSLLDRGAVSFYRKSNQICWFLSSKQFGAQRLVIRLDLRLTLPSVETTLAGRVLDGVFMFDHFNTSIFSAFSYIPNDFKEERVIVGDDAGFLYGAYEALNESGGGIDFQYFSHFMDCGNPSVSKRFHKVVVWVEEIGSWPITLDYWAGYRASVEQKSTLVEAISDNSGELNLWDVAFWDAAYWDDFQAKLKPLVFNLHNTDGNSEGDSLRIRIRNGNADEPVTVYGFSVLWTPKAMTK